MAKIPQTILVFILGVAVGITCVHLFSSEHKTNQLLSQSRENIKLAEPDVAIRKKAKRIPRKQKDPVAFPGKAKEPLDTECNSLLNMEYAITRLVGFGPKRPLSPYIGSHGVGSAEAPVYLGQGMLYYAFAHFLRAETIVVLGSGGAYAPRMYRQAQMDLGLSRSSRTILVDKGSTKEAFIKGGGVPSSTLAYGEPQYLGKESFVRTHFDLDLYIPMLTSEASKRLKQEGVKADIIHIDADHSFEGSLQDFMDYYPLVKDNHTFMIVMHDTKDRRNLNMTKKSYGVYKAVAWIAERHPELTIVDFSKWHAGVTLMFPKVQKDYMGRYPPQLPNEHIVSAKTGSCCAGTSSDPSNCPPMTKLRLAELLSSQKQNILSLDEGSSQKVLEESGDTTWMYLGLPAWRQRYMSVIPHLTQCTHILEVGGYVSPVYTFMDRVRAPNLKAVTNIEPKTKTRVVNRRVGDQCIELREYGLLVQDYVPTSDEDCLVLLGMDSFFTFDLVPWLKTVLKKAKTVVLETPSDWKNNRMHVMDEIKDFLLLDDNVEFMHFTHMADEKQNPFAGKGYRYRYVREIYLFRR